MLDRLFCYGTLCVPDIMRHIIGRSIPGVPAVLEDYACYTLRNERYPAVVSAPGESTAGLLYGGLTQKELALLDRYEGTEYRRQRVSVATEEGRRAQSWVYIIRPQYSARLSDQPFDLEDYLETEVQEYLRGMPFRN
ncbi:MAG TPA: gamma-glutamylcyclotransferase family protein [Gammaproteobacteria bacterium]|nr:gamma-glutamylcyclotransferase family protein [Gammaproteobacteria bacterium]